MRADLTCLTMKHAEKLERKSRVRLHRVERANALLGVVRLVFAPIAQVLAKYACRYVDRHTAKMADQAVWFHGVRMSIEDGAQMPVGDDETAALVASLEKAQASIMQLREAILPLAAQFTGRNPDSRIGRSLKKQLLVLSDLFAALESARWAVLEREADTDIEQGRVKRFDSVEDLLADLT